MIFRGVGRIDQAMAWWRSAELESSNILLYSYFLPSERESTDGSIAQRHR